MHRDGRLSSSPDFQVYCDDFRRLTLIDADGCRHEDVEVIRAFPLSDPNCGISLFDSAGHEIVWIDRVSELPSAVRATLEAELSQREFIPTVQRIIRTTGTSEPSQWIVETDRGQTQFLLANEGDVRRLGDNRAMIIDTDGIRYLFADIGALDSHSMRILERYL
jgi:hypothetical protein